ncbi:MAG: acyl-CoA dehydratase activase [bacterium]
MEKGKIILSLDIGSVSVNLVLVERDKHIVHTAYYRHYGRPLERVFCILDELSTQQSGYASQISLIAITGTAGQVISNTLGGFFINEVIAQASSVCYLYPYVNTIIEIGGSDSKLILLQRDDKLATSSIKDFAMNTMCAAGTGSFLDQQATRLGLTIEEFSERALKSEAPPRIAGRCSVFAKTDMIHLQQEATPDYDIVAGLCYAMARNFKSNIGRAREFKKPLIFQGGVAANKAMIKAFEKILGLNPGELLIPQYYTEMGAIGAALICLDKNYPMKPMLLEKARMNLKKYLEEYNYQPKALKPLSDILSRNTIKQRSIPEKSTPEEDKEMRDCNGDHNLTKVVFTKFKQGINAYLGVDIGSISTNVVVMTEAGDVLAKCYLMTAGRPIEAIRKGLSIVGKRIGKDINIVGVGTTGSGRYLIADFIGGDIVKNEITAQARAAAAIDKRVDTIFEIGGQDSKYIQLKDGVVVDFEMNKVCAAGTGSFLEEQAEKLRINIKEEFGKAALSAKLPVHLGERCTVFMEQDLVAHQQNGALKDNLIAGLAYSIVYNYLNWVVGNKKIGDHIFFQGGVAANKGVLAAFEKVVEKKITVPPHHEVTGAIGVALIAKENRCWEKSLFKGFDLSKRKYAISSFECKECPNVCQIRQVKIENEKPLFYGSRCDKYDIKKRIHRKTAELPDLFEERRDFLLKDYGRHSLKVESSKPKIGIPWALFFHELLPFFKTFFNFLGCEVILSDPTNKKLIDKGVQTVVSETCFPIKVAYGHIQNIIDKKAEYIFLPSIINLAGENYKIKGSSMCPYVQTIPYTIKSAIDFKKAGVKLLDPVIFMNRSIKYISRMLGGLGRELGCSLTMVKEAVVAGFASQREFYNQLKKRGREILTRIPEDHRVIVVVSRPYNGCDCGLNLHIPNIFRELGVVTMPMDYLLFKEIDISQDWPNMYWRYGQRILSAGMVIKNDPRLYAVYITNFGCGPDSFITKFFQIKMEKKPYLQIEVDEHSVDVGAITRCEAFYDSIEKIKIEKREPATIFEEPYRKNKESIFMQPTRQKREEFIERTVYIPYMSDHAFAIEAGFQSAGIKARVMEESDEESKMWGRKYTSGRQCYPCILTTGNIIKTIKQPGFDPKSAAFLMPGGDGPCRFGQYSIFQRVILDELGYAEVPIFSPNQGKKFFMELFDIVGKGSIRRTWGGIVAIDLLDKKLRETRPYEYTSGETDKIYKESLSMVCQAIKERRPLEPVMGEIGRKFETIKVDGKQRRPIIGIVGEIYVRSNPFSNDYLVHQIEKLGGEVWVPSVTEWFFYTNYTNKRRNFSDREYIKYLILSMIDLLQKYKENKLTATFAQYLKQPHELSVEKILNKSQPYLHESFEGEAILSVGKAVDFREKGVDGIINIMPFTCMPGNITTALLKKFCDQHEAFPCLNISYDGLEQTNMRTRLEAFMYQASQLRALH